MVKTKNLIAVITISLVLLVALIVVGLRLYQRTTFRNEMRPLVQEDLSDFAQESESSGGLAIETAVLSRMKRIAEIKLFEVGHYQNARDLIVQLMEAENSYLVQSEEAYENGIQIQTDETQMKLSFAQVRLAAGVSKEEGCSALRDALTTMDTSIDHVRLESVLPELIEADRKKGVRAWNRSYGWMRWMGLDVDPHNPFSSVSKPTIRANFWKALSVSDSSSRAETAKGLQALCGDTR
jgi:hypothetical protein